ncbi:FmdB family zinc ribbon protein [Phycisphaera mikurensis]|uniref:Putative regulatory protein FmdB zinc ribbon domain-containing protein n=1 Tax=Phycisphaera mikurensis (strain NBRC 102666 / KCTC 22515 / FYK2301M01) TaxID=1142394 RepID=I0IFV8_PHYMF|nr:zinc ribbon domain-containing protein [Phycisphaera mikurensis]MBB6440465.1 putative FmdB family regulatory protein [Phycisphaera mikurensis]BAM04146.1 hypothetical protein PSMK_19870 [Phycisphaera mikurensis NBRC 102666]
MPTYEYVCKSCGQPTEHFASMSAKPLRKCPHCGKNQLERQIGTGAGFIFKGGGFYETDYRSEGYKKSAKEDQASSEPKGEPKGDKPASGEKPPPKGDGGGKPDTPGQPAPKKKAEPKPAAGKPAPKKPRGDG